MQKRFGQLIRETRTVPAHHGAITEQQAICFFDRSSMWSQYVDIIDQTDDLSLLFAYPASMAKTGHVETSTEWVMVYRYYPQHEPERTLAMEALNSHLASNQ